jgi:hypothetical protein
VVKVVFECVEDEYQGSRIWFNATASIHERSKLRPLIEAAAFDHDPTIEELEDYDTDDLKGNMVYVSGEFGPKDTAKKFLRPTAFMRYKGKKAPRPADDDDDDKAEAKTAARKQTPRDKALAAAKAKAGAAKAETKVEAKPKAEKFDPAEIPF